MVLDFVATGAGSGTWASEPSKPDYGRLKVLARRLMKSATFERDPSGLAERLGGLLLGPGKAEHVRYEVRRVLQEFEKGRSKLEPAERTPDTAERTLDAAVAACDAELRRGRSADARDARDPPARAD